MMGCPLPRWSSWARLSGAAFLVLVAASWQSAPRFVNRNGDGRAVLGVVREDPGGTGPYLWYFQDAPGPAIVFGRAPPRVPCCESAPPYLGDTPEPGDYDGDGKTDVAVFRPDSGEWMAALSGGGFMDASFGSLGDIPVPADYDGDGVTDLAVYRQGANEGAPGLWSVRQSSNGEVTAMHFGENIDQPILGDFDCDGRTDFAVRRMSAPWDLTADTAFFVFGSSSRVTTVTMFGKVGDVYVPGDLNGDGCDDLTVVRASDDVPSDLWWYSDTAGPGFLIVKWGHVDDTIIQGDFNGDGRDDIAVALNRDGHYVLYARDSATGSLITSEPFGNTATDVLLNRQGVVWG